MTRPGGPAAPSPIRVVIADDHAVVRDGLEALVDAQPGFAVVCRTCSECANNVVHA